MHMAEVGIKAVPCAWCHLSHSSEAASSSSLTELAFQQIKPDLPPTDSVQSPSKFHLLLMRMVVLHSKHRTYDTRFSLGEAAEHWLTSQEFLIPGTLRQQHRAEALLTQPNVVCMFCLDTLDNDDPMIPVKGK